MADTDFYKPVEKDVVLLKKFDVADKFVVSYIGAIGLANGLDFYIECARACQKTTFPCIFCCVAMGRCWNIFRSIVKQYQLKNFSILPFQNREGVKEVMNVTDATFICYKPVPILETGSPNKYFDGLAAGKLILINFAGWVKEEIEKERCGVYINPKSPDEFVKKIEPLVSDGHLLKQYQQASRLLAESKYSRKLLSEKFAGNREGGALIIPVLFLRFCRSFYFLISLSSRRSESLLLLPGNGLNHIPEGGCLSSRRFSLARCQVDRLPQF